MIQKQIYTFWGTEEMPKICEVSINSWKIHCPEFEIMVLNLNTFKNHIKRPIPKEFNSLTIQKKTNWIRCVLIYENGGIWMDASILLTQNINDWFKYNCDFLGIQDKKRIENWFFAAPKNSLLILEWIKEYEYAMSIGGEQYEEDTMKLVDWDKWPYLYHQLCFLRACQLLSINIFDKSNPSYCIKDIREIGYPKADTTYKFKNDWANEFRYNSVRLGIKSKNTIPLYKFTNFTRFWAEKALKSKIQRESPLYLAGFRNKSKGLYKIYFYSNLTFLRNILAKYYTFLISNLSAK